MTTTTTLSSLNDIDALYFKNLRSSYGTVTFTAQWTQTSVSCADGEYLKNGTCNACETGFTSDGTTATEPTDCYKEWSCPTPLNCPEHATCSYSGETSGTYYYTPTANEPDHCAVNYSCETGYHHLDLDGAAEDSGWYTTEEIINDDIYDLNAYGTWATELENGVIVRGEASCNNNSGNGGNPWANHNYEIHL